MAAASVNDTKFILSILMMLKLEETSSKLRCAKTNSKKLENFNLNVSKVHLKSTHSFVTPVGCTKLGLALMIFISSFNKFSWLRKTVCFAALTPAGTNFF